MATKTLYCPFDRRYRLVLDPNEVIPENPGEGTPAMVYGPKASGTLTCVVDTGEMLSDFEGTHCPPTNVVDWLASDAVQDQLDSFLQSGYCSP